MSNEESTENTANENTANENPANENTATQNMDPTDTSANSPEGQPTGDSYAAPESQTLDSVLDEIESQPQNASSAEGDAPTIDFLQSQVTELTKRELQAQAELENFRKRTKREVDQQIKYAKVPFARDILEVVDNLGRACEAASNSADEALLNGVQMVHQQLVETLAKNGIVAIEAVGKVFDPNFHQAISQAPSDEHESGIVMHEAAIGYQLEDRIVRPSQVIVSTGPVSNGPSDDVTSNHSDE